MPEHIIAVERFRKILVGTDIACGTALLAYSPENQRWAKKIKKRFVSAPMLKFMSGIRAR